MLTFCRVDLRLHELEGPKAAETSESYVFGIALVWGLQIVGSLCLSGLLSPKGSSCCSVNPSHELCWPFKSCWTMTRLQS